MQLSDKLSEHFRLQDGHKRALSRLGIESVRDLLYHFPTRYDNISDIKSIAQLAKDDRAVVYGEVQGLKTRKAWRSKRPIAEGYIEDGTGRIKLIWFNQPYLAKMIPQGAPVKLAGRVTGEEGKLYIANPEVEQIGTLPIDAHESLFKDSKGKDDTLYPIYPESKGVTSKWFYHAIVKAFKEGILDELTDPIPEEILARYNLPALKTALIWMHTPKDPKNALSARKRFAFEEVFLIQLARQQERKAYEAKDSFQITIEKEDVVKFTERFPFKPTKAQQKAIDAIIKDLKGKHAMARLLEGDVGSGKTAVAAATVYAVTTTNPKGQDFGNLQTAYMVPTEILAKQHFESFISYFHHLPINIGLITGSGCKKFPSKVDPTKATDISRTQLLKWVENGEIPILIGTHALIQKTVKFKNLAYVIIDEQHRFGTAQRQKLVRKDNIAPHLLSMTATPIPRTLALTIYGDLDLTLLDEMPAGRKPIITDIVTAAKRDETYEKIRKELESGRQAYIICPRIDEPDPTKQQALYAKSVKEEAKRLKKDVFKEYEIEILHSKMTPKAKDDIMNRFASGEIDILVATSVVEVGVNVPNATVILIEGAERFGLAQLHQLRGRVLRSTHQAYCYLFPESKGKTTLDRLKAIKTAKNGFELAEHDLALRGSGELSGGRQWGMSDVGMEAMKNIKMVEAARNEAEALIEKDPTLVKHKHLSSLLVTKQERLHFE